MDNSERPKTLLAALRETGQNYAIAAGVGIVLLCLFPSWLKCISLYVGAVLFLACVLAPFVQSWRPRSKLSPSGKAVFISGCDSGFGHMLAQKLDDTGYHVFAGCLFPEGDGAANLRKSASSRLQIVALDVTKDDSVQNALQYVSDNLKDNKLWAVVNNAGLNDGAELSWTHLDIIQRVIEVNTFGVVRVTKAFLPLICKHQGRVVAVASAAGRYTYPGLVPYCMSKQATVSFCDGLRLEMYRWGVQVITVEPWMFKTPITDEKSVVTYIKRTWDRVPEEVKKSFGPNYLDQYIKSSLKFLNYSISNNPQEVVSCLEEAVTAKNPRYSYNPGTLYSRLSFWLLQRLPKPVADMLIFHEFSVQIK